MGRTSSITTAVTSRKTLYVLFAFVLALYINFSIRTFHGVLFLHEDYNIGSEVPSETDSQSSTGILDLKNSKDSIIWCAINRHDSQPEGKRFHHFPHAMLVVSKCWSYFVEHNSQAPDQCGFLFDIFTHKRLLEKANTDWVLVFLEASGCSVKIKEPPYSADLGSHIYIPELKSNDNLNEWHSWINKVHHAQLLRDLILRHRGIQLSNRRSSDDKAIRVGFLNRHDSRRITNINELIFKVMETYHNVVVDIAFFTSDVPWEQQIIWFASHDIIIGPHGASMTNCLFMQPNATVIEIFPQNYFPYQFFGSMITQVGGEHKTLYSGHSISKETRRNTRKNQQAGIQDYKDSSQNMTSRHYWRNIDFEVNIEDVIYLLDNLLERKTGTAIDASRHQYKTRLESFYNKSNSFNE